MIGVVGGQKVIEHFSSDRYPMSVEHSILESCIASDEKPLKTNQIQNKKNICVCSFYKTLEEYDYEEYKKDEYSFLNTFDKKSKECR